ncbi:hypothetical protein [Niabella beijingensis]|uniref:hypothetical protein n=1 Tax=Niabella beijingensis TaxID=2872700 RepID=UPI001CBA90EE|nr:hypothetical protein [Niabella beijingensis]MBZ4188578.1 hypothetical protein [Niabella beijingensis]
MLFLKRTLLFILFCGVTACVQPVTEQVPQHFAGQLETLCRLITGSPADRSRIILAFAAVDPAPLFRNTAVAAGGYEGFYPDSIYSIVTPPSDPDDLPVTTGTMQTWRRKDSLFYEITFNLRSTYKMTPSGTVLFEQTANGPQLSFPELNRLFGKEHSLFPAGMQPKESKYYYYRYTNPENQGTALIKTRSFFTPGANYNSIYTVTIISGILDPQQDKSGDTGTSP